MQQTQIDIREKYVLQQKARLPNHPQNQPNSKNHERWI